MTRHKPASLRTFAMGIWSLAVPGLFLAGCKVGPDYQRPPPLASQAVPEQFAGVASNEVWKPAEPAAHLPRGDWWQLFADAKLERLEQLASGGNLELAAALARLDEARASLDLARADLFPQADFDSSFSRQRDSRNKPESGHAAGLSPTFNTFTAQLQAGWEADLWGRVRRHVEAGRARLAASAADVESLRLATQAEVAADYFALRALDAEAAIIRAAVQAYRRSLELTVNRRKGGIASDLDVFQAETQLRSAEAELPVLQLDRIKLAHALATLCGQPATGFELEAQANPLAPPPNVPLSLPSELLERRPDIAAAEQRMAAANAQIGTAQGGFYPRLRFNGLAGLESIDASTWLSWPSRFWAVGPALELPLFTGGRNRAQLALSRAAYLETVAVYRQTVLRAFQEVEDQLITQQLLASQLDSEAAALAAARRTLQIAENRYQSGLVSYLEVASAQSVALLRQRVVVQLQGKKLLASVALVKALGGRW